MATLLMQLIWFPSSFVSITTFYANTAMRWCIYIKKSMYKCGILDNSFSLGQ